MILSLAPDYTEHIYSAVSETRKTTQEHRDTVNQVVAVYSIATGVEQENSTL